MIQLRPYQEDIINKENKKIGNELFSVAFREDVVENEILGELLYETEDGSYYYKITEDGYFICGDHKKGISKLKIPAGKFKMLEDQHYIDKDIILGIRPEDIHDENVVASIGISSLTLYDDIDSLASSKLPLLKKAADQIELLIPYSKHPMMLTRNLATYRRRAGDYQKSAMAYRTLLQEKTDDRNIMHKYIFCLS